jgi:hypothetical protein
MALVHLAEHLRDGLHMDVVTQYRTVRLNSAELAGSPILYMTGHYRFSLSGEQRTALADYLRRGGFLYAEACCGRPAFDESLREMIALAFPDAKLSPLPLDHVIFQGAPGYAIRSVTRRPRFGGPEAGMSEPPRLLGLEIDGRLVVVYSPRGIGCGLDGHECPDCDGLVPADAMKLATNVILYALTH